MKLSKKFLAFSTLSLAIVCVALTYGLLTNTATAQSGSGLNITHMSGDANGVWMATDDERLVHCWFPNDPSRTDTRANCRVVERFRVNVLR